MTPEQEKYPIKCVPSTLCSMRSAQKFPIQISHTKPTNLESHPDLEHHHTALGVSHIHHLHHLPWTVEVTRGHVTHTQMHHHADRIKLPIWGRGGGERAQVSDALPRMVVSKSDRTRLQWNNTSGATGSQLELGCTIPVSTELGPPEFNAIHFVHSATQCFSYLAMGTLERCHGKRGHLHGRTHTGPK